MAHQKNSTKRSIFLWIIIFSHTIPIIVSAFYDKANHSTSIVKLSDPRYWFWAFIWWSAWTSLITIPWAFYKLFNLKKNRDSGFKEQMWDMIIAEANFISGLIFCCGGFLLTIPSKNIQTIYPLIGSVKPIYIWFFYNFFWHVLAPRLSFYYFWNYCKTDKLKKRKSLGLITNLFNPTVYFLYVMLRPLLMTTFKPSSNLPHHYPTNYPYPPFFWIVGQFANKEETKIGKNYITNYFSWKPSRTSGLIWLVITFALWYLIFSLLFFLFIKINKKKNNLDKI
jgi:hypothetical protein